MKVTRIFWDLLELMTGFVFILLRVHQQKYTVSRRAHLVFSAHLPISNQLFECFDIEPAEFFYATEIKQSRIIKNLNNNYFHNLYYIIHPPARQKWAAVWMEEYVQACYLGILNVVEVFGTNLAANVESIGPTQKGRYFGNAFLKAHRQICKKRCFEMYCYVIKHAIFQLYRVHTDEVIQKT